MRERRRVQRSSRIGRTGALMSPLLGGWAGVTRRGRGCCGDAANRRLRRSEGLRRPRSSAPSCVVRRSRAVLSPRQTARTRLPGARGLPAALSAMARPAPAPWPRERPVWHSGAALHRDSPERRSLNRRGCAEASEDAPCSGYVLSQAIKRASRASSSETFRSRPRRVSWTAAAPARAQVGSTLAAWRRRSFEAVAVEGDLLGVGGERREVAQPERGEFEGEVEDLGAAPAPPPVRRRRRGLWRSV